MEDILGVKMRFFKYIIYYTKNDDVKKMYIVRYLYHNCRSIFGKKIFKNVYDRIMRRNCASIPIDLNIVATFPHGLSGIFISKKANIGKNCVIFQQVTIGSNMLNNTKHRGAPSIGNSVYICAGAKIIGNIIISDNVRVGANAVVYKNVPRNSTVVLNGSRVIIKNEKQDNRFIDISNL